VTSPRLRIDDEGDGINTGSECAPTLGRYFVANGVTKGFLARGVPDEEVPNE